MSGVRTPFRREKAHRIVQRLGDNPVLRRLLAKNRTAEEWEAVKERVRRRRSTH